VRWKRMSGFNTLWLPGTDHAGIGTQMVVDRLTAQNLALRISAARVRGEGGSGRKSTATRSSTSYALSARPPTGAARVSRWTRPVARGAACFRTAVS
jgi:hypothetical protein